MRNWRGYHQSVNFMAVIIFFLVFAMVVLLYFALFVPSASAGAVQTMCSTEDEIRSRFAEIGPGAEMIAGAAMPVQSACGEIINTPCSPRQNCIELIQDKLKNCWVRGNRGAAGGEKPCVNALPIGNLGGRALGPREICGPYFGNNPDKLCQTKIGGIYSPIDDGYTYETTFNTEVPNDRITWTNTPVFNAVKNSAITMRYAYGKVELTCISAYDECKGVPTPT